MDVDAGQAFAALQEAAGQQVAQLLGDIAAKNAYITKIQEENQRLLERITALEQNRSNGAGKSGADLSDYPLPVPHTPPPRKTQ